jgi:hypothetical protein
VFDLVTHGGGKVILESSKVAFFEKLIEVKKVLSEQYFVKSQKSFVKFFRKIHASSTRLFLIWGVAKLHNCGRFLHAKKSKTPILAFIGTF